MLTAYIQIFTLFGLIPLLESVLYCFNYSKNVCYPCLKSTHSEIYCNRISNETKIISFHANTIVNYGSYLNSNIRIIQEPNQLTFYYCDTNVSYIHVPKMFEHPLQKLYSMRNYKQSFTTLQHCLKFYCSRKLLRLMCVNRKMFTLDFRFGKQVTLNCVQNIVSANIFSLKITHLQDYQLFIYAQRLIYLKLDFPNLKHVKCFSFENLVHLRLLDFSPNLIPLESYKCIFYFNPTIVRIGVDGQDIWSTCKGDIGIIVNQTKKSTTLTVAESMSEEDREGSLEGSLDESLEESLDESLEESLEKSLEESLENSRNYDLENSFEVFSGHDEDQSTTMTNRKLGNDSDSLYNNGKKYFILIIFMVISVIAIINIIYKIFPRTLKSDQEQIYMDTLPHTRPEAV